MSVIFLSVIFLSCIFSRPVDSRNRNRPRRTASSKSRSTMSNAELKSSKTSRVTCQISAARNVVVDNQKTCFSSYADCLLGSRSFTLKFTFQDHSSPVFSLQRRRMLYRYFHIVTSNFGLVSCKFFLALPMPRCWSFLAYTPNWAVALFLLLLHPPGTLYLLTLTVRKHSNFQTPLENPSIQTHLVLMCCIKRLCIFGPKGAIQIRYLSI